MRTFRRNKCHITKRLFSKMAIFREKIVTGKKCFKMVIFGKNFVTREFFSKMAIFRPSNILWPGKMFKKCPFFGGYFVTRDFFQKWQFFEKTDFRVKI